MVLFGLLYHPFRQATSLDGAAIEETMVLEDGVAKGSLFLSGPKVKKAYGESGKESNVVSSVTASKAFAFYTIFHIQNLLRI